MIHTDGPGLPPDFGGQMPLNRTVALPSPTFWSPGQKRLLKATAAVLSPTLLLPESNLAQAGPAAVVRFLAARWIKAASSPQAGSPKRRPHLQRQLTEIVPEMASRRRAGGRLVPKVPETTPNSLTGVGFLRRDGSASPITVSTPSTRQIYASRDGSPSQQFLRRRLTSALQGSLEGGWGSPWVGRLPNAPAVQNRRCFCAQDKYPYSSKLCSAEVGSPREPAWVPGPSIGLAAPAPRSLGPFAPGTVSGADAFRT
ncbi:hypothetical protein PAL_GLEAN10007445 [Pteropus alecto]|uniref:Uncharacterized protein n=1 Tax=Pteropus alecto TaxID=9402 RepID=L5L2Q8_PTEAL|nr:hypothetical protein PAL_GLEAN10007445 [Pteropus alecto]